MTATIQVCIRTFFSRRAGFAARVPDHFGEFRKRHDVAADVAIGDQRAQKRAGIVG